MNGRLVRWGMRRVAGLSAAVAFPVAWWLMGSWGAEACPMCKEALFDLKETAQRIATAKGYALSIGLLLAMPFALVGGVGLLIVQARRRLSHDNTPMTSDQRRDR